jgi:hypothetical protein
MRERHARPKIIGRNMPTPEQRAREVIDASLMAAGWVLQDASQINRNAAEGVAVRDFALMGGPCDYLLFVGGKAAGVVEAKKTGVTLSGVAEQAARYMVSLPEHSWCSATNPPARRPTSATCAIRCRALAACSPSTSRAPCTPG